MDHITPKAKGGTDKPDNLQSLCAPCHTEKTRRENMERASAPVIGADGWPVETFREDWLKFGIPFNLGPSAIPVTLVFGPPCSGKTTWVKAQMSDCDTLIDLDDFKIRMFGTRAVKSFDDVKKALAERDQALVDLTKATRGAAFVVMTGRTRGERNAWKQALGSLATVKIMQTKKELCVARLRKDMERREQFDQLSKVILEWE